MGQGMLRVLLLKLSAATHGVTMQLTREPPDALVNSAFRNVSGKGLGTMWKLVLLARALFFCLPPAVRNHASLF